MFLISDAVLINAEHRNEVLLHIIQSRDFVSKNSDPIQHLGSVSILYVGLHDSSPDGLLCPRLENASDCHQCPWTFLFPALEVGV
ncbi:hypothetical protein GJAV_G00135240 [Gymnothorax javanicus]|nr:hypothetical protein GJAV_G00135240 [Gymnothorax javanicus]